MNRESMEALKLDRRLLRRRGWINKDDLARALDALPDVADKVRKPDAGPTPGAATPPGPDRPSEF